MRGESRMNERSSFSKSEARRLFQEMLQRDGVEFTSKGLPDFLVLNPQGGLYAAVYVTSGKRRSLRTRQLRVVEALMAEGIRCCGWSPTGSLFDFPDEDGSTALTQNATRAPEEGHVFETLEEECWGATPQGDGVREEARRIDLHSDLGSDPPPF
jgi:hypothetical protein